MANDKNKRARKDDNDDDEKNKNPNWMNEPPYALSKDMEGSKPYFTASCHCEDVTIDIYADKPKDAKFCHCDECQKMHGSAMHWSVALEKEKVHFKCHSDKLHFYRTSDKKTVHELPCKVSCYRCHSHLCDEGRNMMLMYPATWNFKNREDRHEFLPNKHIFYSFRAIDVHDGMDKWSKMADESEKMDESSHHGQQGIVGKGSKEDK